MGTTDADKVMAELKKTKINDMFAKGGYIRADGAMVHDMYVMQVKTPAGIEVSVGLLQGGEDDERRRGLRPDHGPVPACAQVRVPQRPRSAARPVGRAPPDAAHL